MNTTYLLQVNTNNYLLTDLSDMPIETFWHDATSKTVLTCLQSGTQFKLNTVLKSFYYSKTLTKQALIKYRKQSLDSIEVIAGSTIL